MQGTTRRDAGTTPPFRIHHSFMGTGTAYDGERALGSVAYSLRDVEELHRFDVPVAGDAAAPSAATGERGIYGTLTSREPGVLVGYVGARLALVMADDRRLDFTVAKVLSPSIVLINALGAPR